MSRRQEVLLAAGGTLLALVAGTLLLVRPKQHAVAEARADRNAALAESQTLSDQIRALEALKADEAALRARARQAKAEFPARPDLPALVEALQDAADQAGLDLASVAPSTPKPSTERPELAEIETTVTVTGGYFQIEDFLAKVENLVKGTDPGRVPPRAVLIRSVDVSSSSAPVAGSTAVTAAGSASPDQLLASITLAVFQLARSPATGAPATGTAATATTHTTQAR